MTGDGCTVWFNGDWRACCDVHDAAYSAGVPKITADLALAKCVADTGHPINALIMFVGVTLFGAVFWFAAYLRRKKL